MQNLCWYYILELKTNSAPIHSRLTSCVMKLPETLLWWDKTSQLPLGHTPYSLSRVHYYFLILIQIFLFTLQCYYLHISDVSIFIPKVHAINFQLTFTHALKITFGIFSFSKRHWGSKLFFLMWRRRQEAACPHGQNPRFVAPPDSITDCLWVFRKVTYPLYALLPSFKKWRVWCVYIIEL